MSHSYNSPVGVITTGGTLDKLYDVHSGSLVFGQSCVPDLLTVARIEDVRLQPLFAMDSLDMTDDDRYGLLHALKACPESHLVVTHGTDTLQDTARYLIAEGKDLLAGKTVVLTGAMRPYRFGESDAAPNVVSSIIAARLLPPGIWACIHGQIHAGQSVCKDRARGVFFEQEFYEDAFEP